MSNKAKASASGAVVKKDGRQMLLINQFSGNELIASVQPDIGSIAKRRQVAVNTKELGLRCFQEIQPLRLLLQDYVGQSQQDMFADLNKIVCAMSEQVQPTVQLCRFCCACHQKVCLQCYAEKHAGHESYLEEPNDYVCRCAMEREQPLSLKQSDLYEAIVILYKVLWLLTKSDKNLMNRYDDLSAVLSKSNDFAIILGVLSLAGENSTLRDVIRSLDTQTIKVFTNCAFSKLLELPEGDSAQTLVNFYSIFMVPAAVFRKHVVHVIFQYLNLANNAQIGFLLTQLLFYGDEVDVHPLKRPEYAVQAIQKFTAARCDLFALQLLGLLLPVHKIHETTLDDRSLESVVAAIFKFRSDAKGVDATRQSLFDGLLQVMMGVQVDQSVFPALIKLHCRLFQQNPQDKKFAVDGTHFIPFLLSRLPGATSQHFVATAAQDLSVDQSVILEQLVAPILQNVSARSGQLGMSMADTQTLQVTQATALQYFLVNFPEPIDALIKANEKALDLVCSVPDVHQVGFLHALRGDPLHMYRARMERYPCAYLTRDLQAELQVSRLLTFERSAGLESALKRLLKDVPNADKYKRLMNAQFKQDAREARRAAMEKEIICAQCKRELNGLDAVLLVNGTNFCPHLFHGACCQAIVICPICKFESAEQISRSNIGRIHDLAKAFKQRASIEMLRDHAIEKVIQFVQLNRALAVIQGSGASLKIPKSTHELVEASLKEKCPHCQEQLRIGQDDQIVRLCCACGAYQHARCGATQCRCGQKTFLNVNSLVFQKYVAQDGGQVKQIVLKAPYYNALGQNLHHSFGENQILSEMKLIDAEFLLEHNIDQSMQLTKKQVKQLQYGESYIEHVKEGDEESYASEDSSSMLQCMQ